MGIFSLLSGPKNPYSSSLIVPRINHKPSTNVNDKSNDKDRLKDLLNKPSSVPADSNTTANSEGKEVGILVPGDENEETTSKVIHAADTKAPKHQKKDPNEPETLTEMNTRLNLYLFNNSQETIDMYKQTNDLDLVGRLYYDDYDSSDTGSGAITPVSSAGSTNNPLNNIASHDFFNKFTGGNHSKLLTSIHGQLLAQSSLSLLVGKSDRGRTAGDEEITLRSLSTSRIRPQLERLRSFEKGILFDTSLNNHQRGLTLKVKHPHFKFRRNNKTYLAGYNGDKESLRAIEWLFDEMIVNGDSIIVLQVLDEKKHTSVDRKQAEQVLRTIELLNVHVKKTAVVLEITIGKPQKLLKRAIDEYAPNMMIIGTHHYEDKDGTLHRGSHLKLFILNKLFLKHFLECALVPVIVVKPLHRFVDLPQPIDLEEYFQNWISNINAPEWTYLKDKHARRKQSGVLSPTVSRNTSETNLRGRLSGIVPTILAEPRDDSRLRSRLRTRLSKLFL